ncbi:hypothetical protein RJ641_025335, partial [Dillenia turbinata]
IHFWFLTVALLLHVEAVGLFGFESESWECCWFVSSYGTCCSFFGQKGCRLFYMLKLAKIATAEIVSSKVISWSNLLVNDLVLGLLWWINPLFV